MKTMSRSSHCFGIEDELFDKRVPLNGQITKREIRALSISYLHIGTDTVLWDIGSATGSVAIEASRIATQGKIIAIEKDRDSLPLLQANVAKHKANNVEIVEGTAPQILKDLESPDSVFIGGTGGELSSIITSSIDRLFKGGSIVMNFASIERSIKAYNLIKQNRMKPGYLSINISKGKELVDNSLVLTPLNPVFIVYGRKQ